MISSLELAKICGVSQGTVDRALHNRKGISEITRRKILEAAGKYGYQPHPAAREILTGKSMNVGAVIPQLSSVFFMDLMADIKKSLLLEGFKFVISQVEDEDEFLDMLSDFSARRFTAAVVIPPRDNFLIPENLTKEMKVISLLSPCKGENTFFITPEEERTGRDAVRYFVSSGRKNIIHLTYPKGECHAVRKRAEGYENEMKMNNLKPVIISGFDGENFIQTVRRTKADAVFCHNDWLALSALRIFEKEGFSVPEDISVLGVDNSPTFNELCPDISTMGYPFEWMGKMLCKVVKTGKIPACKPPAFRIIKRKT